MWMMKPKDFDATKNITFLCSNILGQVHNKSIMIGTAAMITGLHQHTKGYIGLC